MDLKIYEFSPKMDKVIAVQPVSLFSIDNMFIGLPMKENWQPPEIELLSKSRPLKDFVSFQVGCRTILFSENAMNALYKLLYEKVEFLPITQIKNKQYYALNVTNIVDCLDKEKTRIDYVNGKIATLNYIHFIEDKIYNDTIFKVPESMSTIFVNQTFVNAIIQNNLTGAVFHNPNLRYFDKWEKTAFDIPDLPK